MHPRFRLCLASLLVLSLVVSGCNNDDSKTQGSRKTGIPPVTISTASPHRGDIGVYVNALGVVTPVSTVSIKSRVDGQLVAVYYKEGQEVKAGDLLAEIDAGPYQAALTQTEGQFARDKALLENARLDLERYKEALGRNAIPKQQYEGTVQLDQGLLDNARVQLAYCHIVAPVSGRVGLRLVDPGNIVHASDTNPIVVITQFKPMTVIFTVAEDYLPQIQAQLKEGKTLTAEVFDRTQSLKLATGFLLTLDNQIDTSTGTLKLRAQFENEDGVLFPNQFVNARLLVDTRRNILLLQNTAIQRNAQGAFVYLIKPDHTVSMQPITVGTTDGTESAVEGIEQTDQVAADNFSRLADGTVIALRSERAGQKNGNKGTPGSPDGGAPSSQEAGQRQDKQSDQKQKSAQ